jgi:predicted dienelactone hydrolase
MQNQNSLPGFSLRRLSQYFALIQLRIKITTLFLTGIFLAYLLAIPANATDKILLSYGPEVLPLQVSSLEQYAQYGTINPDLAVYLSFAPPAAQQAFQVALKQKIDLDPDQVIRFFHSKIGESILNRLGQVITLQGGVNGHYALRSAIEGAALSSDGLTLLNVIKQFPTHLQLQGELIEGFAQAADVVISATATLTAELQKYTAQEAASDLKVDFATLPDLRKPGSYGVRKQVWQLTDASRHTDGTPRIFYVNIYSPQKWRKGKTPVVVFSHGLASRPEDFAETLQHLTSYGYLVAAPQHPGSDRIWLQDMLQEYHSDIFDVNEFLNRPQDISYLLDELQRRNLKEFQGKLDLNNVGIAGHSFGGYTALAIAGAEIDFENLQQDCNSAYSILDLSLLLQCRALELPHQPYSFHDKRIKAVIAANPVNRSIFGKTGLSKIAIPTVLGSGSYDPATPPALEQANSFTWLTVPDKYWAMIEGQAHVNFTKLDPGIQQALKSVGHLTLPPENLIDNYVNAITVAFFESYIAHNDRDRPYLQSSYADYLSKAEAFRLNLVSAASTQNVADVIAQFKQDRPDIFGNDN